MKRVYPIENLTCAHCAEKIEEAIRHLEGVRSVSINIITKKLIIDEEEKDHSRIIKSAAKIMKEIEPDASIGKTDDPAESDSRRIMIIRIVSTALLTILSVFVPFYGILRLVCFLLPYCIIGYDVLFSAGKNLLHGRLFDEKFLMSAATIGAFALGEYIEGVAVMLFYQLGEFFQTIAVGKSRSNIMSLMDMTLL